MARCLIGCGSNLGDRREQLDRAVELLRSMPGVSFQAVSRFRETRPVGGPSGQPAFLNGACLIETDLPAGDVLAMLMAVENTLHRDREARWAARTIDLDLLLYDDLVVDSDALTLPHPRMATRRFVLEPSAEIAADLPFPLGDCRVRDLLDNISAPHPFVAVVGVPGSGADDVAAAVADATLARLLTAPVPLPPADAADAAWVAAVQAWARPLVAGDWQPDPHGTVADYWADAIAPAAAELPAAARERVHRAVDTTLAAAALPQVAILLVVDEPTLRARHAAAASAAVCSIDVRRGTAVACAVDAPADVAPLLRWQERLVRRLRCPGERGPRAPKAVITIDARDPQRAAVEAIAAVEAML
jgi:2-amino-4-hydroxy-6-hydroxymethyldihydropteridine diphosphokinase